MARNLVICCDGTNNQFGSENTSVVRLVQVLNRDPARQRLYYDPGVGTLPEPNAASYVRKKISEWWGLAFGAGLTWKVQEAYAYLMDAWEPGDQIFLFGFSRGAYTARVLAGLLHGFGLLPRGNQNLIPYLMRLYEGVRDEKSANGAGPKVWKVLSDEFRSTFCRAMFPGDNDRRCLVNFLGLWDTVSSVGYVWDPPKFPYTTNNPSVKIVRHAVSIDERRWFFRQNLMKQAQHQDLKQYWFSGVHSDVGGGYAQIYSQNPLIYSRLWRIPFEWMVTEAKAAGLLINDVRLSEILNEPPPAPTPWNDPQHESLTPGWWVAEVFPKKAWNYKQKREEVKVGLGRYRSIGPGALIHHSVLLRIRETNYSPKNFSASFLQKIRQLADAPEVLPFEKD